MDSFFLWCAAIDVVDMLLSHLMCRKHCILAANIVHIQYVPFHYKVNSQVYLEAARMFFYKSVIKNEKRNGTVTFVVAYVVLQCESGVCRKNDSTICPLGSEEKTLLHCSVVHLEDCSSLSVKTSTETTFSDFHHERFCSFAE